MANYAQLSPQERCYINERLRVGNSRRDIAQVLGRCPATISREVRRNRSERVYRWQAAQRLADERKAGKRRCVRHTEAVKADVRAGLKAGWSPEQVAGRRRHQGEGGVSHETIYRHIWRDKADGGDLHTFLRHTPKKRSKRYGKKDFRGRIPHRVDISERPAVVDARTRFGDWEGDTVVGKGRRGALVTLAERKSRLVLARSVPNKTKAHTAAALTTMLDGLQTLVAKITYDNGREFSDHAPVSEATGSAAYFARPYHSWERGSSEHSNGPLRQYFPKSMAFDGITQLQVDEAVARINNRPRKCRGYLTPIEVLKIAMKTGEIKLPTSVALLS